MKESILDLYQQKYSELYPDMNDKLRKRDRKLLKPFFPYMKHLLTGRAKLPKFKGTVWRGVKVDLRTKYPKDKEFYWWAFSSVRRTPCPHTSRKPKSNRILCILPVLN